MTEFFNNKIVVGIIVVCVIIMLVAAALNMQQHAVSTISDDSVKIADPNDNPPSTEDPSASSTVSVEPSPTPTVSPANRVIVSVYSEDGAEINSWEGNFVVSEDKNGHVSFYIDGKQVHIHSGVVIVEEV